MQGERCGLHVKTSYENSEAYAEWVEGLLCFVDQIMTCTARVKIR